jgi:hypothetical protein
MQALNLIFCLIKAHKLLSMMLITLAGPEPLMGAEMRRCAVRIKGLLS